METKSVAGSFRVVVTTNLQLQIRRWLKLEAKNTVISDCCMSKSVDNFIEISLCVGGGLKD